MRVDVQRHDDDPRVQVVGVVVSHQRTDVVPTSAAVAFAVAWAYTFSQSNARVQVTVFTHARTLHIWTR